MNRDLLELAADLSRRHQPFLTATVVWARGPSSGKRGSTAILEPDGTVHGWIGGACAEPVVIRESREAMADGKPRLLFLGTEEDIAMVENRPDVRTVPISCTSEGSMEVFLEPMLPSPHLVAVGGSPAVKTLMALAETLDWRVDVVDEDLDLPEISGSTAIVVATQGHYDEPAVEAALTTDAGYIGLVASSKRAETVLGYLRDRGHSEEALGRVVAPAGLDLGHIAHREIGVSIVADLVKRRAAGELRGWPVPAEKPHVAIDPVCEMEVEVATARWISEHDGETYYFCAPGCKAAFEKAPAEYAGV
ncbi:MAG TPA: XdhC family protein [Acidimicrobiia bacterium]